MSILYFCFLIFAAEIVPISQLNILFIMKKVFDFIESLKKPFYDLLGFPTIKVYSDYVEVYFDCSSVIRDLSVFEVASDEFRMFSNEGFITVVFTFYINCD